MTLQVINNGSRANDETAETLFSAFEKVKSNFSELYGIYGSEVEAFTFTTKQDDLAIATGARIVRWNGAGSTGITGIAAPASARVLTVVNASTDYLLWLENENTASAAANRLMLPDGFPAFLMPGDTITLVYDLTTARWRVLSWPTRGMQAGLTLFSDQAHESSLWFWTATGGTGATSAGSAGGVIASAVFGSNVVRTGTTATGFAEQGGGGWYPYYPSLGPALVMARLRLENTADGTDTWRCWVGLGTAGAAASKTDAIAWEYWWNGAAHEWGTVVMNNTVAARSTANAPTPATGTGDYVTLGVFVNPGGTRADFLVSTHATGHQFTVAQSVSSGLPASARGLSVLCPSVAKIAGTNTRGVRVDWSGTRIAAARAA